jgi:RNA polymerase subunit RPABC4/transcription elongation factor Spt4
MAVTACEACGNKVNEQAAVCPHCGKRRATPGIAGSKLSKEEIGALIAIDDASRPAAESEGLFETLVLPHPNTSGAARTAELVLTVLSFPLIVAGVSTLAFRRRTRKASRGELSPVIRMTVIGGVGMVSLLALAGMSTGMMVAITGGSIAALWARGIIRARATSHPELMKLTAPEPAPPPTPRGEPPRLLK